MLRLGAVSPVSTHIHQERHFLLSIPRSASLRTPFSSDTTAVVYLTRKWVDSEVVHCLAQCSTYHSRSPLCCRSSGTGHGVLRQGQTCRAGRRRIARRCAGTNGSGLSSHQQTRTCRRLTDATDRRLRSITQVHRTRVIVHRDDC